MRAVFVLFDSLVRDLLPQYGGDGLALPNFARLDARRSRFDTHYVGSLPCMPARRDLHNGRLNFFTVTGVRWRRLMTALYLSSGIRASTPIL